MKMKKLTAILMSMALGASVIAGCGASGSDGADKGGSTQTTEKTQDSTTTTDTPAGDAEDVTLKIWVPEEEVEFTSEMVDKFDELHDEFNISYEIAIVGIDEAAGQLETDADIAADIFYVPSGGILDLTNKGLLLPITKDVDQLLPDLPESAVNAVTVNGFMQAVPFSPNTYFMYYNKDFYNEEELKSLDTMMAKDFGEGKWNFSTQITNSWYAEMFFLGNGCTLFGEDGTDAADCTFNNENGFKSGSYMLELAADPKYLEDADGVGGSAFKDGNLGAVTSGAWSAPEFREALGDKLGAIALPTAKIGGQVVQLSNFVDFKTIAVKSNTQFPLCAQQLAVYLVNQENSLTRYKLQGDVPVLKSLSESDEIKNDYVAKALNDQAALATSQPSIPQMGSYWDPMKAFGDSVYYGEINLQNLQEKLDALVTSITSTLTE